MWGGVFCAHGLVGRARGKKQRQEGEKRKSQANSEGLAEREDGNWEALGERWNIGGSDGEKREGKESVSRWEIEGTRVIPGAYPDLPWTLLGLTPDLPWT
ncbi:hypothetical protein EG028_08770 [Chitinophaga barathri]|uniref:Uncharacterized protein n=1 Tax=Chitinophaga barathri TaxID=1647451 RepID=A0A3N4MCH4_9BACT|nr:hypothetical protein EG028_08770 [Chitinophaga barathri]